MDEGTQSGRKVRQIRGCGSKIRKLFPTSLIHSAGDGNDIVYARLSWLYFFLIFSLFLHILKCFTLLLLVSKLVTSVIE